MLMLEALETIMIIGFVMIPLLIQCLLYLPAKLIFKKLPAHRLYTVCFIINTIILLALHYYFLSDQDPAEMEPMDAFDGLILYLTWAPWYIGIFISCIVRNVKSKKKNDSEIKTGEIHEG